MTNEQLVCRIQAGENVAENMNLLYDQVKAFIHMIAIRYQSSGMVEDLEQEGTLHCIRLLMVIIQRTG